MMANKTFLGSVHRNQPEQRERPAGAVITPGMLVQETDRELVPHVDAGFVLVAKELTAAFDADGGLTTDYQVGDTAQAYIPESGDMYWMLLAAGQTVEQDSPLESNGAGLLIVAASPATAVAFADEAITTADNTPVRVRFK